MKVLISVISVIIQGPKYELNEAIYFKTEMMDLKDTVYIGKTRSILDYFPLLSVFLTDQSVP